MLHGPRTYTHAEVCNSHEADKRRTSLWQVHRGREIPVAKRRTNLCFSHEHVHDMLTAGAALRGSPTRASVLAISTDPLPLAPACHGCAVLGPGLPASPAEATAPCQPPLQELRPPPAESKDTVELNTPPPPLPRRLLARGPTPRSPAPSRRVSRTGTSGPRARSRCSPERTTSNQRLLPQTANNVVSCGVSSQADETRQGCKEALA